MTAELLDLTRPQVPREPRRGLARLRAGIEELRLELEVLEDCATDLSAGSDVSVIADPWEAYDFAFEQLKAASLVRSLDPMSGPPGDDPDEFSEADEISHEVEMSLLTTGQLRSLVVITPGGCLGTATMRRFQREATLAGECTRSLDTIPKRLLIFDDHSALLGRPHDQRGALLIRSPLMIDFLTEWFHRIYDSARAWHPDHLDNDPVLRVRVLELMSAGLVDDAIARRLQCSPRTVARVIGALMQEHGCSTRFQLGRACAPDLAEPSRPSF